MNNFSESHIKSDILSKEDINTIANANDFHISPLRHDGQNFGTPTWIWSVSVNDQLYVRAYNGTASRWYKAAMEQGIGKIKAAGIERKVRFKAVENMLLNEKIDLAYREKYTESPYLNSMISERAKKATVQILSLLQC